MMAPLRLSSFLLLLLLRVSSVRSFFVTTGRQQHQSSSSPFLVSSTPHDVSQPADAASTNEDDDEAVVRYAAELLGDGDDEDYNSDDWLPDRERAVRKRQSGRRIYAEHMVSADNTARQSTAPTDADPATSAETGQQQQQRPSPYTDEEEQLITAMGGRTSSSSRDPGYLGDSTLEDISRDYGVPLCWIADVLCTWGVPVPIVPQDRLGDLVTGEQAFAMVEAVNTFDGSVLYDRYGDFTLERLCFQWDIDLGRAVSMVMKEGWGLPFGVQTFLRVEQEKELLRVLGDHDRMRIDGLEDDDE